MADPRSFDVLDQPVTALAAALRDGRVTAPALVEAHIARLDAINPLVNALTARRFDAARAEAQAAQAALEAGEAKPLTGIPCTIKEFFGVTGMPWTGGLVRRRDVTAPEDATAVARLRAAGAIVLATTNAPEGGLWMETYNDLYGRTSNPWDLRRTPGGSSGGEGAVVAAGGSAFGLGSDVGGSIRIPAAFCGTFGHKPSALTVPNTGHFPPSEAGTDAFLCAGPLTRSADDLALLMEILAGPDGRSGALHGFTRATPRDDLRGVRVIAMETNGRVSVRKSLRGAVRASAEALVARGATLDDRPLPGLARGLEIWTAMLSDGASSHYDEILTGGGDLPVLRELLKLPFGRSQHTFAALALTAADQLTRPMSGSMERFVAEGRALQAALDDALGNDGVLLHPPYSRPAPRHRDSWRTATDAQYTAIFNVMGSPVTIAPVGFDPRRLPLAVQVVGARGQDALTIEVARHLEQSMGGWTRAEPARR